MRRSATRAGPLAALATLAWVLGGCGGPETAIVLEVTTGPDGPRPERLAFVIAPLVEGRWVRDRAASFEVDVGGRDLTGDPYRLLLTDGRMAPGEPFAAAVIGYPAGVAPVPFAALLPLVFLEGSVLLHEVTLTARADVFVSSSGCLAFMHDGQPVTIALPDDLDCRADPAAP
jgi:hypothetical protein